jgi:hypothetical protein
LIAYLKSDALVRPIAVTSATTPQDDEHLGRVTSTIVRGELFLHPLDDPTRSYRLRWEASDKERARALPAGTYKVSGYRHVATDNQEAEWIWSTTSPGYADIEVKAGETVHFPVCETLEVNARAREQRGKRRVALVFVAEKGLGNTLYRKGKRITIRYECLDAEGDVVGAGNMNYG